jgi:hypothetical protein
MKHILVAAALPLSALFGTETEAATFTATVFNGTCGFLVDTSETGASKDCGTASAAAGPGALRARVEAFDISATSGFLRDADVRAAAILNDVIFFDGLSSGTISIPLDFGGSIELLSDVPEGYSVGLTGAASAAIGSDVIFSVSASFSTFGGFTATGTGNEIKTVAIPIVNGQAAISASIGATASCQLIVAGGVPARCSALVDYGSSLRFLAASVFDPDGNLRDDVLVTSQSGFDYRKGVEPHSPSPEVIPVPAPAVLLLTALLGLGVVRKSARRA